MCGYRKGKKQNKELLAKEKIEAVKKRKKNARPKLAEEERLKREAEANAKPAEGTIETLASRTGRYYVVAQVR